MAIVWADFPSGQVGLYGTNTAHMLNGIWAQITFGWSGSASLAEDPDPNTTGNVLRTLTQASGSSGYAAVRFALPVPAATEGFACRIWLPDLPEDSFSCPFIAFRNAANADLFAIRVLSTGAIEARSSSQNTGTLYGTTTGPALVANAWNHLEVKGLSDPAAGTIEVRVNGNVKLNLDTLNTGAGSIAQMVFGTYRSVSGAVFSEAYWKDVVFWDTSGTVANDFQGSVSVYDLFADADVSLNWVPSIGALGYPLITDDFPSGTLTVSGLISDGNVVRIDNTYYRFSSGSLDSGAPAGTSANPWRVLIGATEADSMLNLFNAIGATGVAGTDYSTALTAHTTVDANGVTATQVSVEAKLQAASAIVTTETGANLAWAAGTLTGGPTDPSYIEADATPPAAAVFTMTNLPPDVTSVRALIPIFRGMKTDGGDCAVQAGLSPDNATWVNGADEPQTVAFTFYWSPIHTDPVTAAPWTPGAVNGAYVRVNRTL